jgi:DNA-directed RNA polymerase subunit RPC12/RpoP
MRAKKSNPRTLELKCVACGTELNPQLGIHAVFYTRNNEWYCSACTVKYDQEHNPMHQNGFRCPSCGATLHVVK